MREGWTIVKIGDACEFKNGLWKGKKEPYTHVGVIRNTNFTKEGFLDDSDIAYLDVESKQYSTRKLQFGDIILEKSGGGPKQAVGRVVYFDKTGGEYSFSNFTSVIRVFNRKQIEPSYLHRLLYFYYLSGATEVMQKYSTGIRNLQLKEYKDLPVPLPSLSEQKRIVTILDEVFDGIGKAIFNAEKNLKNTRELYETIVESLFTNIIEDYETIEFGAIISTLTDYHANGAYAKLKEVVELKDTEDYAWMVRSTDFEKNFKNGMRFITKTAYEYLTKSQIFGGEIIMSKIGNAGKVYLMPDITRPCSLAMNLFLIRVDESRASNKFIYRYLKSKSGEKQILSKLRGAATQTITKDSVRELKIPLFSKKDQDRIVLELEKAEAKILYLENIYQQKLTALTELKQSILKKAFAGELTEKDTINIKRHD